uniref:Putative secreted peptide n=1 Tax=Anopheles braziliensis TaxID=58242 RepID=A0A2M3ZM83_9DIPT
MTRFFTNIFSTLSAWLASVSCSRCSSAAYFSSRLATSRHGMIENLKAIAALVCVHGLVSCKLVKVRSIDTRIN